MPASGAFSRSNPPMAGQAGLQPGAFQPQSDGLPSSFSSSSSSSTDQSGSMSSTSTTTSSSSSNQSSGMPLGGNTASSLMSPGFSSPNFSFGQNSSPSSSSDPDELEGLIMPPRPKPAAPPGAIEVKFEIVVVCRKNDIVLQPGSYRVTGDVLRSAGPGKESTLAREIRAMVRNRALVDPLIRQKPTLRFLVESQGADTFVLARRQLLFALPDWPVSLQVAGSQDMDIFNRNRW